MSEYLNDRPDDDRRIVTEVCPNCDNEVSMVWDVEQNGYKATCPYCGGRLMLCDECQHPNGVYSDDCDYDALTQSCRYNCAANYREAEKAVKLLSQFCKGRTQQWQNSRLHPPTEADADRTGGIIVWAAASRHLDVVFWQNVVLYPQDLPFWMPAHEPSKSKE